MYEVEYLGTCLGFARVCRRRCNWFLFATRLGFGPLSSALALLGTFFSYLRSPEDVPRISPLFLAPWHTNRMFKLSRNMPRYFDSLGKRLYSW